MVAATTRTATDVMMQVGTTLEALTGVDMGSVLGKSPPATPSQGVGRAALPDANGAPGSNGALHDLTSAEPPRH